MSPALNFLSKVDLLKFPTGQTKANSEYADYIGKITDKLNDGLKGTKYKKYTYGRVVKLLKGVSTKQIKDMYHYWEKREKEGYPFGKGFIGQLKKNANSTTTSNN